MPYALAVIAVTDANGGASTSQAQYGPFNSERKCMTAAREIVRDGTKLIESERRITAVVVIETFDEKIHYRLTCLEQEGI